uniref:Predicted protein n=1 Tax=Hordeum vulgare subsp. vulgare TaxID=112509 RepID=F2E559_HORVV|nr:predicted protein [Hordeum vulgare subsp. vulgare]
MNNVLSLLGLFFLLVSVYGEKRIVGGSLATQGQFPFQVALVIKGGAIKDKQYCAGSLINDRWVLTAAHCLKEFDEETGETNLIPVSYIYAFIGQTDLTASGGGEIINVIRSFPHPDWTYQNNLNGRPIGDIALIALSRPVTKGTPINLPTEQDSYLETPSESVRVIGWGSTNPYSNDTSSKSDYLRYVDIPIVNQVICQTAAYPNFRVDSTHICAGTKGKDSCQGDSGGPLFANKNGVDIQVGVVSTGTSVKQPLCTGVYGVYTRVSSYVDWINSTLAANENLPSSSHQNRANFFVMFALMLFINLL